jgi:putative hydrolase of the HAD superfamily
MKKAQALDPLYLSILGTKSRLVDGAREMLQYLKEKGYRLCLISNGFYEVQYRKMKSAQIEDFFEVVVLSDDIGVNKPDRRIFDHALRKAGATAEESIIIGDNPDADIKGAIDAGWKAIYFNREGANVASELPKGIAVVGRLCDIEHIL